MEPNLLLFIIFACLIFYFTFRKVEAGLYLLVVAIPLSFWEIPINFLPHIMTRWYSDPFATSLTVNLADIVIAALLLKSLKEIKIDEALKLMRLPLSVALILVLITSYLSVTTAAYRDLLTGSFLRTSLMYLLKFTEVILIYFIVLFNIKNIVEIKRLVVMFIIVGTLTAIASHIIPWMSLIGRGLFSTRLIVGGFYCILSGICFSLMLNEKLKPYVRVLMEILLIIFAASIIVCLKRSTYVGLFVTTGALLFMRPEKKVAVALLLCILLAMASLGPVKTIIGEMWNFYAIKGEMRAGSEQPGTTQEELEEIVREETRSNLRTIIKKARELDAENIEKDEEWKKDIIGIGRLDPSIITRFYSAFYFLKIFMQHPIFGIGYWATLSRRYCPHNTYIRILSETGIIGFAAFLFALFAIVKNGILLYLQKGNSFISDFACGFLAGFIGIMTMGIFSEIFTVFTLMQAVFFMIGMVAISNRLLERPI